MIRVASRICDAAEKIDGLRGQVLDRRGRSLSWKDVTHYQRIVKILAETDRIMKEIEAGGVRGRAPA